MIQGERTTVPMLIPGAMPNPAPEDAALLTRLRAKFLGTIMGEDCRAELLATLKAWQEEHESEHTPVVAVLAMRRLVGVVCIDPATRRIERIIGDGEAALVAPLIAQRDAAVAELGRIRAAIAGLPDKVFGKGEEDDE